MLLLYADVSSVIYARAVPVCSLCQCTVAFLHVCMGFGGMRGLCSGV